MMNRSLLILCVINYFVAEVHLVSIAAIERLFRNMLITFNDLGAALARHWCILVQFFLLIMQ